MEHKKKRWWFNFFSCERGREGEIGVEGEVTQKGRWSLCVRLREKNLRNSAWIGRISGGGGGESEEGGIAATCCHALSGRFSCVPPRLASLSHALILRNTGKTSSHLNMFFFFFSYPFSQHALGHRCTAFVNSPVRFKMHRTPRTRRKEEKKP